MYPQPSILAICPTYGRPRHLLETTLACWAAQEYPADRRHLLIVDDLGNLDPAGGKNYSIVNVSPRYPSLPAKYNGAVAGWPGVVPDVIAVWEDDDIYLPWHLSKMAEVLSGAEWSHPMRCFTTHPKPGTNPSPPVWDDSAAGRMHASLGFRYEFLRTLGGWPDTQDEDFDQQLIRAATARSQPGRPDATAPPSYVFRWHDTQATHGQHEMARHGRGWYTKHKPDNTARVANLTARYDVRALATLNDIRRIVSPTFAEKIKT